MTPDEILALLRLVARLQQQVSALEGALQQAQGQQRPDGEPS